MNTDKYNYIWEAEKDDWCLINTEYGYGIINKRKQMALMVSDDILESAIIDKMLKAGNKIYDDINLAYADI